MIKRVLLCLYAFVCFALAAYADQAERVELNLDSKPSQTVAFDLGQINISYERKQGTAPLLNVYIENTNPDNYAIIFFSTSLTEKELKKESPSIKFHKNYNGSKYIDICKDARMRVNTVVPEEKSIIPFIASFHKTTILEIPYYIAKIEYKKNGEIKNLIIQDEEKITLTISVEEWGPTDITYVRTKEAVENFIKRMNEQTFCTNPRHPLSIDQQLAPWLESRDSLLNKVNEQRLKWAKSQEPYKYYDALILQLDEINWDAHKKSGCTQDKPAPASKHKCTYCGKDAKGLYQIIDNTYQQLNTGKISAEDAKKTAKAVNECLLKNKNRKKDTQYETKIDNYYQGIMNY